MKSITQKMSMVLTVLLISVQCGTRKNAQLHYDVNVRIEPSRCRLEGRVIINNPPDSCFYLNPDFDIDHIIADGREVAYRCDTSATIPYTAGRGIILPESNYRKIMIAYSGIVDGVVNGVNMINPDLIELAYYTAWIPLFKNNRTFSFSLKADIPSDFMVTTNGCLEKQKVRKDRVISSWKSYQPDDDLLLAASPHFKKLSHQQEKFSVEVFYTRMPENSVLYKKEHLLRSMNQLIEWYGPPQVQGVMRFIYSPRSGSGYSRIPAFVVSEDYGLSLLKMPFGDAHEFHGDAHEMAHFWWTIADPGKTDDWINEGLAEYTAFRLSEQIFGSRFADILMQAYRRHAAECSTVIPIAETAADSPDCCVNRHEKTTLLFIEAGNRFGNDPLQQVLSAFYNRYTAGRDATAERFLETVRFYMTAEAEQFFREALFSSEWHDEKSG